MDNTDGREEDDLNHDLVVKTLHNLQRDRDSHK